MIKFFLCGYKKIMMILFENIGRKIYQKIKYFKNCFYIPSNLNFSYQHHKFARRRRDEDRTENRLKKSFFKFLNYFFRKLFLLRLIQILVFSVIGLRGGETTIVNKTENRFIFLNYFFFRKKILKKIFFFLLRLIQILVPREEIKWFSFSAKNG